MTAGDDIQISPISPVGSSAPEGEQIFAATPSRGRPIVCKAS